MRKTDTKKPDTVVIDDPSGRRRFIRTGAAFVLAASSVASAQEDELRVDCDRQGMGEAKDANQSGSDSDSGANADRPGCGTRKPTMTEYNRNEDGKEKVKVKKVIV